MLVLVSSFYTHPFLFPFVSIKSVKYKTLSRFYQQLFSSLEAPLKTELTLPLIILFLRDLEVWGIGINVGGLKLTKVMFNYWYFVAYLPTNTTGVNCTWSGGGSLEVDLQHCKDPVYYHLFLNVPSKGIRNKGVQLKQGKKFRVYNDPKIGEVYLHVKTLSRKGNVITTNVSLCL